MLDYILLGLLHYESHTGYDLKRIIDHSTAHFWHAHQSQIYTTLRRLEARGLINSEAVGGESEREKRLYTLSEAGRAALHEWLAQPLLEMPPIKDELLVRLFFSGQRPREDVVAELRVQLNLHRHKLALYVGPIKREIVEKYFTNPACAADVPFWQATLRAGIFFEEAYIRWLEETISDLENRLKPPAET